MELIEKMNAKTNKLSEKMELFEQFNAVQEDLANSKSLMSLGLLLSSVVHELNNPLAGISMSVQLSERTLKSIKKDIEESQNLAKNDQEKFFNQLNFCLDNFQGIHHNVNRSVQLFDKLIKYTKKSKLILDKHNASQLIDELLEGLIAEKMLEEANISLSMDRKLELVCDKTKIQQVLYALLKNAVEASPNKLFIEINVFKDTDFTVFSVKDHGHGISNKDYGRVLEPFYTTREKEGGRGIGLTIAKKIIELHGGMLTFCSEVGRGTEFVVKLPQNFE